MRDLPTGTVTFLFTDIEGSTRLLQRLGDRYWEVVDEHGRIVRDAIAAGRGTEIHTEGDSFFAVFPSPRGALAAAVQAQRTLAAHPWPEGYAVRVRMGLHTGEGVLGGDDYIGLDVHLAARIGTQTVNVLIRSRIVMDFNGAPGLAVVHVFERSTGLPAESVRNLQEDGRRFEGHRAKENGL